MSVYPVRMVTISVVMPAFNQARFIGRAIDSVLGQQGNFNLELIVVDGGSTDGTLDILRSYGDRIRWVSEPDEGQSDALNKGLALVAGEVMGWLNSDDVYEAGALGKVTEVFAAEPDTMWVYGKVRVIDEDDREVRRWLTRYKNRRMRRWSYPKLLAENWISQMGVFWRREAWRQVGDFNTDLHLCMDYDYWLRLGQRWPGRFIDEYLGCFRWYPTSKSGAGFVSQFREELDRARLAAGGRYRLAIAWHHVLVLRTIAIYSLLRLFRKLRG